MVVYCILILYLGRAHLIFCCSVQRFMGLSKLCKINKMIEFDVWFRNRLIVQPPQCLLSDDLSQLVLSLDPIAPSPSSTINSPHQCLPHFSISIYIRAEVVFHSHFVSSQQVGAAQIDPNLLILVLVLASFRLAGSGPML